MSTMISCLQVVQFSYKYGFINFQNKKKKKSGMSSVSIRLDPDQAQYFDVPDLVLDCYLR